jgi:hypothetical protein
MPVLHRPTFLHVYEQYLANPESGHWQNNKQAYAQLFLIFEISALSNISSPKKSTPSYEAQWRKALYSTSSNASLATLQCHILAQICYILRADYTHLARHRGIAITMCHELGLHQGHKYHSLSPLEAESKKKAFWCQYVLDKYVPPKRGFDTGFPLEYCMTDIDLDSLPLLRAPLSFSETVTSRPNTQRTLMMRISAAKASHPLSPVNLPRSQVLWLSSVCPEFFPKR